MKSPTREARAAAAVVGHGDEAARGVEQRVGGRQGAAEIAARRVQDDGAGVDGPGGGGEDALAEAVVALDLERHRRPFVAQQRVARADHGDGRRVGRVGADVYLGVVDEKAPGDVAALEVEEAAVENQPAVGLDQAAVLDERRPGVGRARDVHRLVRRDGQQPFVVDVAGDGPAAAGPWRDQDGAARQVVQHVLQDEGTAPVAAGGIQLDDAGVGGVGCDERSQASQPIQPCF